MSYEFVLYEKKDRIATITMNRPEVMNAIHPPMTTEMSAIFDDAIADDEVWVIVLTGAGERAFSAGNDLKYTAKHGLPSGPRPAGGFGGLTDRQGVTKPILAAVNGVAMGGGLELALACDILIAADHARLGLPEPRVGLVAAAGGVHRLPRRMPFSIAMGYMLTGKPMSATEAHRWGLVNEVVPLADLLPTTRRWAGEILECAPLSVRASKECALGGLGLSIEHAMAKRYPTLAAVWHSEDMKEGPRAFAEKRKPDWKGK